MLLVLAHSCSFLIVIAHYDPATLQFAREHDVIVLCLPPHTTHEAQPLDCCVFGPLKRMWTDACHEFTQNNPGRVITKFQFSSLFSKAWNNALTPANITSGFRKCGVFPFNQSAISMAEDNSKEQLCQHSSQLQTPVSSYNPTSLRSPFSKSPLSPVDTNDSKSECTTVGVTLAHPIEYTDNVQGPCWSSDEEELYERWLEEGYDLPNSNYTNWLKIRHPEVVPNEQVSVADHFPDVSPQSPIVFLDTSTPLAGVNAVSRSTTSSSISRSFEPQLQSCQSSALKIFR